MLLLPLSTPLPPLAAEDGYSSKAQRTREDYFRRQDQGWDKEYKETLGQEADLPSQPSTFPSYPTSPPPPALAAPSFPLMPTSPLHLPLADLLLTPQLAEDREEEEKMLRYLVKVCLTTKSKDIIELCRSRAINIAKESKQKNTSKDKKKKPIKKAQKENFQLRPLRRQSQQPSFLGGLVSSLFTPIRSLLGMERRGQQGANRRIYRGQETRQGAREDPSLGGYNIILLYNTLPGSIDDLLVSDSVHSLLSDDSMRSLLSDDFLISLHLWGKSPLQGEDRRAS